MGEEATAVEQSARRPLPQAPKRRPILPEWVKDPQLARKHAEIHVGNVLHLAAWQGVRLPKYGLRWVFVWAPRGAKRAGAKVYRYVADVEGAEMKRSAKGGVAAALVGHEKGQHMQHWIRLASDHDKRILVRALVVAALSAAFGLAAIGGVMVLPGLRTLLGPARGLVLAVLVALGWYGRPKDKPLFDSAVEAGVVKPKLTMEQVQLAFRAASLATEKDPVTLPGVGVAMEYNGYGCDVLLPPGKTASEALKVVEKIASGLRRSAAQVFVEPRPEIDAGLVHLWVANADPFAGGPVAGPLMKVRSWNFWDPIPIGLDERGRTFKYLALWTSGIAGSIPRRGKTNLIRQIALAAALDPYVRLIVWEGKGMIDWQPFERVAHFYGSGVRDGVVRALADQLEQENEERERRGKAMQELYRKNKALFPEAKVTQAVSRGRNARFPLTLIVLDEFQELLLQGGDDGARAIKTLYTLAKLGPAMGIIIWVGSQKPDAKSIPSGLRDQFGVRVAGYVPSRHPSDVILGDGAYSDGVDASKLPNKPGIMLIRGVSDDTEVNYLGTKIKTFYYDMPDVEIIVERALELRREAGTLTGMAAGEDLIAEGTPTHLLEDLADIFTADDGGRLWSETVCERLAVRNPHRYSGWTPTKLAQACGVYKLLTRQIWDPEAVDPKSGKKGLNRRGLHRDDVTDALSGLTASRMAGDGTLITGTPRPQLVAVSPNGKAPNDDRAEEED
jgi:DNA segregation ATPase FtsK/SpoIIIE, S-DNA-T family